MSRTIRCEKCNKLMGEIRDANLRKGIVYYCEPCHANIKAKLAAAAYYKGRGGYGDIFGGIFK